MADREALARIAKIRKLLDAISVASVAIPSPAGDVVGLASDVGRMAVDPSERTLGNAGLAMAGLIPGVPSPSAARALGPTSPMGEAIGRTLNFDDQMKLARTVLEHKNPTAYANKGTGGILPDTPRGPSGIPMVDAANAAAEAKRPPMLDFLFDAEKGVGAVPNNLDVKHLGRVEYMRPSQYLDMAEELSRPSKKSMEYLTKKLEKGEPFGQPTLTVDVVDGVPRVVNHDGRHRTTLIQERYGDDVLIPVHVIGAGAGRKAAKETPISDIKGQRKTWDERQTELDDLMRRADALLQRHKDK